MIANAWVEVWGKRICKGMGTFLIILALVEPIAFATLKLFYLLYPLLYQRADNLAVGNEMLSRDGILDHKAFARELNALYYQKVKFHPYRSFLLPENYIGQYVVTDAQGFRIDRRAINTESDKIGFFGGSTMFSLTKQDGAIPQIINAKLDRSKAQALNFGVGAYSSTNELITFIEVLRTEKNLKYAVFYDGVNEYIMYTYKLTDHFEYTHFNVLGYFYPQSVLPAMNNLIRQTTFQYEPYVLRLIKQFRELVSPERVPYSFYRVNLILSPGTVDQHAEIIASIYLQNVHDIVALAKSRGVVPVFFWQPDIFTTRKPLTARELAIRERHPSLRILSQAVSRKVSSSEYLRDVLFFNIADTFDSLDQRDQFLDFCHVTEEANRVVAERMVVQLRSLTPAEYWNIRSVQANDLVGQIVHDALSVRK